MIAKKNPKFNEDKRRGIYFQLGLMVVSASAMMAFTWRSPIHAEGSVPIVERSAEIPEIQVLKEIEKPKVIVPKVEKVEPTKKLELKMTKDLNKDLDITKNKDVDEKSGINDDRFKDITDGKFDIDIGDRPKLGDAAVKFPDKEALFQGSWLGFLKRTVVYPEISIELGDQANIHLSFIVEKDGSISKVKVLNKDTPIELQREAIRVVQSAPKWKPGIVDGEYVRSYKNVSINFILE
jgi:protein TonB